MLSDDGAHFWGRHGAAGLLLRAPRGDGTAAVLLQHRAPWSHQGDTWGLPGGARDSHETVEEAAVREAHEEAGLSAHRLTVRTTVVTATAPGGHWTYTTVIADAPELLETVPNRESAELRWVGGGRGRRASAAPRIRGQLGHAAHRDGGYSAAGRSAALSAALNAPAAAAGSSAR